MSKPQPDNDPIRAQMRRIRNLRGLSLGQAEIRTGIKAVVAGSWERGDRDPDLPQLRRWTAAYGVSLVVVEPDQRVISTKDTGDVAGEHLEYVVGFNDGRDVIRCEDLGQAILLAAHMMPGARVGHRVVSRGRIVFEDGTP